MLDAARSASAKRVTAVAPYYSYSRSDKKDEPRISIAGRLVADLLVTAGAQRILTMTLHAPQLHGFFSVPTDHLSSMPVIVSYFQDKDLTDTTVVTPDMGHVKRATELGRELGLLVAAVSKKRISDDEVIVDGVIEEIQGQHVILVDDEIAAGTSMTKAIEKLRDYGVTRATLVCPHGILCGPAVKNLGTVPQNPDHHHYEYRRHTTGEADQRHGNPLRGSAVCRSDPPHPRRGNHETALRLLKR